MYRAVVIGGGWSGIAAALGAKKRAQKSLFLKKQICCWGLAMWAE